jgi:hypothetical protein
MSKSVVWIDSSATLHVARCHECPFWFAPRLTKLEAHESARKHEADSHPDTSENGRRAARAYAARHAGDSSDVPTNSAPSSSWVESKTSSPRSVATRP